MSETLTLTEGRRRISIAVFNNQGQHPWTQISALRRCMSVAAKIEGAAKRAEYERVRDALHSMYLNEEFDLPEHWEQLLPVQAARRLVSDILQAGGNDAEG